MEYMTYKQLANRFSSPWFDAPVEPMNHGVYEVATSLPWWSGMPEYAHFDGKWHAVRATPEWAARDSKEETTLTILKWRGLDRQF